MRRAVLASMQSPLSQGAPVLAARIKPLTWKPRIRIVRQGAEPERGFESNASRNPSGGAMETGGREDAIRALVLRLPCTADTTRAPLLSGLRLAPEASGGGGLDFNPARRSQPPAG